MPVVSCVGHAIDWTIADLVADVRAQTPTEAAELVTPVTAEVLAQLGDYRTRLGHGLLRSVAATRARLDVVARSYAFREPKERVRRLAQRLDELAERLPVAVVRATGRARERADLMASRLEALSPLRVLARGYSITYKAADSSPSPLVDARGLAAGDLLRTRLAEGEVLSRVEA
jgi:exodeoxyribonuclease VII large subunit